MKSIIQSAFPDSTDLANTDHLAGVSPQVFTHLGPWMSFDLRELEFCVVWVHLSDLFPSWGSQHLKINVRRV